MITSIKLKNWKSHQDSELCFGDGTNVLVGMMGAGKSAVMDGITYALFGTIPTIQSRRIKLDDLITNRPNPKNEAEVEVGFQTPEGEEFMVKRVIERGSGTALSELRKVSGELVESPSASRVTEAIGSLLGLDYDLFERAIYSEQNRLDYFLTLPRGKRVESIDELLGINRLEKARKTIGTIRNSAGDRAEDRETDAKKLKQDPSINDLPVYKQELDDLKASSQDISTKLRSINPELESVRVHYQEFRQKENEIGTLEQSDKELEGAIGALSMTIDGIKQRLGKSADVSLDKFQDEVANLEKEKSEKDSILKNFESEFTSSYSKLQGLETDKKHLRNTFENLEGEIRQKRSIKMELEKLKPNELDDSLEKLISELRRVDDELAIRRTRIHDTQQAMRELEGALAKCPVCETPLDALKKQELIRQRQKDLDTLIKGLNETKARSSRLDVDHIRTRDLHQKAILFQKEMENLPKLEEKHSNISHQLSIVKEEIPNLKKRNEELENNVKRKRSEVEDLRFKLSSALQKLQDRNDFDTMINDRNLKLGEKTRIQQELSKVRMVYDETKSEFARKRLEKLVGDRERLRAELSGKEQLIVKEKSLVDGIQEKVDLITRYESEVKHLRDAAQALYTIQTALSKTQIAMRIDFVDDVNLVMKDLWESIYPYGDFVGIQLAIEGGDRPSDYVLQLQDRSGNWIPVEGAASGGERTDAALVLRISFSLVLAPKLRWIVFDEPTHNLDADGIQELAKVMRERMPEVVRQILLITHEEKLESAVSGYLYRFQRDKDKDGPTRVEQATTPELYD